MLPVITPDNTVQKKYLDYLQEIQKRIFSGDICTDYATRLTVATDNSIYQVIPQAVVFPKTTADIALLLEVSQLTQFRDINFSPRGGGTGANGQSLSAGIIIDCSRHMRNILEINYELGWVKVQAGIILDELNEKLKPQGFYFAPQVSTSNRATIGGMINTDACGNGSRLLGRTHHHVIELTMVTFKGIRKISALSENEISHPVDKEIYNLISSQQIQIQQRFTQSPRTLNGYNLLNTYDAKNKIFNLNNIFCGSEGTLAIVSECMLKLTPIPKFKKLMVLKYKNFDAALRAKEITQNLKPMVIETLDDKLLTLARNDSIYYHLKDLLDNQDKVLASAINVVELIGEDAEDLANQIDILCQNCEKSIDSLGYYITKNSFEEKLFWDLRKKSVGLISKKLEGTRRPIPFIEDTAVPPENLANYIVELKVLLDSYNLIYGMYGHVDAGCVHVRPALDTRLIQDEKLIREISDKVVALVQKYQGVLWGEHGMGYRSEYAEKFFGPELYTTVKKIKTLFDPLNQLNPGKIAVPFDNAASLVKLEDDLRGKMDKTIAIVPGAFVSALPCNGNGACFNYQTQAVMCPSYKVTKNRIHSPKGRAILTREWLRQLSLLNFSFKNSANFFKKMFMKNNAKDFSHEVYNAMQGCLGCKACSNQCPLSVNVPDFKSEFLFFYHQKYFRPLRDYFIAYVESLAYWQHFFPRITNFVLSLSISQNFFKKFLGLCDPPFIHTQKFSTNFSKNDLTNLDKNNSVIILQDSFTSFYDTDVLLAAQQFLTKINFKVLIYPFFQNGKAFHVKGFVNKFNKIVKKNISIINQLAEYNIPMIGLDPSITLTYRDEYKKISSNPLDCLIQLPQEFLSQQTLRFVKDKTVLREYWLLSHCTEKTLCVDSENQWQKIFLAYGLKLHIVELGCCGMAGSYGHETENFENSKKLFMMDWKAVINNAMAKENILTTGFSCREQVKRFAGIRLKHPLEILAELF